jgi:hypothetical protein
VGGEKGKILLPSCTPREGKNGCREVCTAKVLHTVQLTTTNIYSQNKMHNNPILTYRNVVYH